MIFYEVKLELNEPVFDVETREPVVPPERFAALTSSHFAASGWKRYIFAIQARRRLEKLILLSVEQLDPIQAAREYLQHFNYTMKSATAEEITMSSFCSWARQAEGLGSVEDDNEALDYFNLVDYTRARGIPCKEAMICNRLAERELKQRAKDAFCTPGLESEVERIFAGRAAAGVRGHPVHYLVTTHSSEDQQNILNILLPSLFLAGRVGNRRYSVFSLDSCRSVDPEEIDKFFAANTGGTVIVHLPPIEDQEDRFADKTAADVAAVARIVEKYQNQVLTIFVGDQKDERCQQLVREHVGSVSLVPICEEVLYGDRARSYLELLARENGAPVSEELYALVEDDQKGYLSTDLRRCFNLWFNKRLKTEFFPQYTEFEAANRNVAEKEPTGSAYQELKEMIGLASAKDVIDRALDYYKAQKLFHELGMEERRPAMHMVFTGNPGTAKTSVARLFSRIMKENGLLANGNLVEVGRSDLVGKYVGWTAQIVKDYFTKARGGVLFIDEAYSLVDGKEGYYGDEAINTIVQEMENHRDSTVVIFAGYPAEMETFLERNPGLRSRIAFHVPFEDYTAPELYAITELMAKKSGQRLESSVREKLLPTLTFARHQADFGNGRFVRNLLEKARMKQAGRLVRMDVEKVTRDDVSLLIPEDFELELTLPRQEKRCIGFC